VTSRNAQIARPRRAAQVQYSELLLLRTLRESGMDFLVCGSTAAYAYGLDVVPRDLDIVVAYQRERWEQILCFANKEDPQPNGPGGMREPNSFPAHLHVFIGRGTDVISGLHHASFDEMSSRQQEAVLKAAHLDDETLTVSIADLSDLMESWKARGSPRDLELIRAARSLYKGYGINPALDRP
jgi:hypothetical protein